LEKPGVGGRRGGDEGIWATVLWHKGDAGWQSRDAMEREARWRAPSQRAVTVRGEVSFFFFFLEQLDEQIKCGYWARSWSSIGTVRVNALCENACWHTHRYFFSHHIKEKVHFTSLNYPQSLVCLLNSKTG
jgi:hypothetical protein